MSTYDGPTGKATIYAEHSPKSPLRYEGEITDSDETSVVIVVTEYRTVDGVYWYGEVEYTIPWNRIFSIEQPIRRKS